MDGCAKMQALKMAADATSSFGVKFKQRAAIITNSSAASRAARVCNVYVGSVQTKEHMGTPASQSGISLSHRVCGIHPFLGVQWRRWRNNTRPNPVTRCLVYLSSSVGGVQYLKRGSGSVTAIKLFVSIVGAVWLLPCANVLVGPKYYLYK